MGVATSGESWATLLSQDQCTVVTRASQSQPEPDHSNCEV